MAANADGVAKSLAETRNSMFETAKALADGSNEGIKGLLGLNSAAKKATGGLQGVKSEATATRARLSLLREESDALVKAFELLGVESDKSITKKLKESGRALALVEEAYRTNRASLGSLLRAQEAFGDAQDEANGKLRESEESTVILTRAQVLNREGLAEEALAYQLSTLAIAANTQARTQSNTELETSSRRLGENAGLISTQFGSQGTFTFRNGRRVFVTPDGRIIP
jgi:hypothetical protein